MIKLNVPRFQQTKMMCGPYALKQVFEYYGKKIDIKEFIKSVRANKRYGSYAWKLGTLALKNGFDAKAISYRLGVFDPSWVRLPKDKLIRKLQKRGKFITEFRPNYKYLVEFLRAGGSISIKVPTRELLVKYLEKGIPIIVDISSTYFYSRKRIYRGKANDIKGKPSGHFIVIAGIDKDKVLLIDPSQRVTKGVYWTDWKKIEEAMLIWNGGFLVIEPKK